MANPATSSKMTATLTSSAKRILVKTQNYPLREGPASFPAYSDLTAIWAITKNPAHKAYIASVMCIEFTREMTLSKTLCWDLDQFDLIPKIQGSSSVPKSVNVSNKWELEVFANLLMRALMSIRVLVPVGLRLVDILVVAEKLKVLVRLWGGIFRLRKANEGKEYNKRMYHVLIGSFRLIRGTPYDHDMNDD